MKFYSTKDKGHRVSLKEAVFRGMDSNQGLYLPLEIPHFSKEAIKKILALKNPQDIFLEVAKPFFEKEIGSEKLKEIIESACNYPFNLIPFQDAIFGFELFHGPTLSFKDFGARFMARLTRHLLAPEEKMLILVATSGDTGSAVAQAFLGMEHVIVAILYAKGQVSTIQEKQLTTFGNNIRAIEVNGTFDDCQNLVKKAFKDEILKKKYIITTANSINVARLIPQAFYFFYALSLLPNNKKKVAISVPCGNFGHLMSALIAKKMGAPIDHFIAATNVNDEVPKYLETGIFLPKPSIHTISNSMDVGNPSNFGRFTEFFHGDLNLMHSEVTGMSFNDRQTTEMIKEVYQKEGYILDPHGAISYLGIKNYLNSNLESQGIFLATAHPAKFLNVLEPIIEQKIAIPENLNTLLKKTKQSILIDDYTELVENLLN